MVVQSRSFLPRNLRDMRGSSHPHSALSQEAKCTVDALKLDFLDLESISPRTISVFIFYFALTSLCLLASLVGRLISGGKMFMASTFIFLYITFLILGYLSSYFYQMILKRPNYILNSYVYAGMYSLVYLPVAMFIVSFRLEFVDFIAIFAFGMLAQYYLGGCLLKNYTFDTSKGQILFRVASFVFQYLLIFGAYFFVTRF